MWYWWTKLERASIPTALRADFERLGETVVSQIAGSPLTHSTQTVGVPRWAGEPAERNQALEWLREQHSRRERREDRVEAIEIAILVLVAIEALPILFHLRQC
jgi:hypothetical protein